MPNKDTFQVTPIGQFVQTYLTGPSIDPFARNCRWATHTNDLNPKTDAEWHLDALDFLVMLYQDLGTFANTVIFDPPYSPRQIKECYNGIGRKMQQSDAWRTNGWSKEKDIVMRLLNPGGIFLYFGWDTTGMGKDRGFEILEILIVNHGPGHNDTLCMAERKVQGDLFALPREL
jgi:hypothetical protein